MDKKPRKKKKRALVKNGVAKDLRTPKYRLRVKKSKKEKLKRGTWKPYTSSTGHGGVVWEEF